MSFIGATGQDENQENYNILDDKIDANSSYINTLVGIPDPTHTLIYGINPLNPGLFGLVERAEVNISVLQSGEEGLTTDLSTLTTQVTAIQGEVTAIQGEVTAIQGEILAVQGEITGLSGAISTIQTFEIPAIIGSLAIVSGVAGDALGKANKSLGIWDEDANNTYNMKSGNVGIGILPKGTTLNNKLEVNGSINIPTGSKYKINNIDLSYNDLTNKLTAGDRISIVDGKISADKPYQSEQFSGKLPIREYGVLGYPANFALTIDGITIKKSTLLPDIPNNVIYSPQPDWNQNIIGGEGYIYNKPTLFDGNYNSLTNKLTAGTNISIVNNAINNLIPITINGNNIYTNNTGGVGIGTTFFSGLNKLEVGGNVNISEFSKYKINNLPLAFSDLAGILSYNSLTDKLTAGTNISIIGNAINNTYTYTLPTASATTIGGIRVGNNLSIDASGILSGNVNAYVLPTASATTIGGIRVGNNLSIDASGILSGNVNAYVLPTASATTIGGIRVGNNLSIDASGILSANATPYTLPTASATTIGGIRVGNNLSIDASGILSGNVNAYTLPTASTSVLGGVKVDGSTITINASGVISGANTYTLPTATTSILGGVKIDGSTITINASGVISATSSVQYTLPTATTSILGGVKIDNTTIAINASGVISTSGNEILLKGGTNNMYYGWTGTNSMLGRAGTALGYFLGVEVNDIVLRSGDGGRLVLMTGTTTPGLVINNNNVGIGTTLPFEKLHCTGSILAGESIYCDNDFSRLGVGIKPTALTTNTAHLHRALANTEVKLQFTDSTTGTSVTDGLAIYKGVDQHGYFMNYENNALIFGTNNSEKMRILAGGNVGIGTTNPLSKLDIDGNLLVRAYGTTGSGTRGIFFRSDHIADPLQYNCSILTFDHGGGGPTDGISINGNGGVSFCTGANTRNERMRISANGNVGIGNTAPIAPLTIGNAALANNDGFIVLEKCTSVGATRQFRIGLNANFDLAMGDYGGTNVAGPWLEAFKISYTAPNNSLVVESTGSVRMGYITQGAHANTIGLKVYAADSSSAIAIFKHPNDSQGIGIRFDEIYGVNTNQHLNITTTGTGQIFFKTGGSTRMSITSTGVVSIRNDVWHKSLEGLDRIFYGTNSTTYFRGHSSTPFEFRNSNDTQIAYITSAGNLTCYVQTANGSGYDYVGVVDVQSGVGTQNFREFRGIIGTFTGFHRCYIDDEICTDENVDIFKNEYAGRIVISTGKIKTDFTLKKEGDESEQWYSYEGKQGITIEDALPKVQLSRVKKDSRVYGVLGNPNRASNGKGRIVINGCGEGAICVANTNGNIENGDYLQTSDLLGYAERQDDDIHRNYTIAKSVMDCDFQLDSTEYECKELTNGVRVALIACVYKAS